MSDLFSLQAFRGQLRGQLMRLGTYVNKESIDPFKVKCRIKEIEEIWSEIDQVQSEIEPFGDKTENYQIEFEEIYFSAIALGDSLLKLVQK